MWDSDLCSGGGSACSLGSAGWSFHDPFQYETKILEGGRDELGAVVVRDETGSVAAQGGRRRASGVAMGSRVRSFGDNRSWLR